MFHFCICKNCRKAMKIGKIGIVIALKTSLSYFLYAGDEYYCPSCGYTIVTDIADTPFLEVETLDNVKYDIIIESQ